MSPRAAWRLETLGFRDVYVYAPGRADWSAAGLPLESDDEQPLSIARVMRSDVPTCAPGDRVRDIRDRVRAAEWDTCFVVVDDRVVIGRLHPMELEGDPNARAEDVMRHGPSTFRPDVTVAEMREYMREHGLRTAPVTTNDGRLLGLVRFEDLKVEHTEESEDRLTAP